MAATTTWFEGRCGKCVLMVIIDDATNVSYARLYLAETTEAAFDVFGRWVKLYGLPRSVYVDRHGIYRDEGHPDRPAQFGRAMKELGVELIQAHSPQARGRVERRNALFQDRLVKQMRLRGISDMRQANAYLEQQFLKEINGRYAVKARREADLHRPLEARVVLEEVLCVQEHRVAGEDWCVRWRNRWLQIDARHAGLRLPRRRVLVKPRGDGRLGDTSTSAKNLTVLLLYNMLLLLQVLLGAVALQCFEHHGLFNAERAHLRPPKRL